MKMKRFMDHAERRTGRLMMITRLQTTGKAVQALSGGLRGACAHNHITNLVCMKKNVDFSESQKEPKSLKYASGPIYLLKPVTQHQKPSTDAFDRSLSGGSSRTAHFDSINQIKLVLEKCMLKCLSVVR